MSKSAPKQNPAYKFLYDVRSLCIKVYNSVYGTLTNYKVVKVTMICALTVFFSFLTTATILAMILTNYNPMLNWISDLGSIKYTPFPLLLDIGLTTTGILIIPMILYLEKLICPIPKTQEELDKILAPRIKFHLASYGHLFSIVGVFGMIFVGIFSEDLSAIVAPLTGGMDVAHGFFSVLVFGGFAVAGFFHGLLIVLSKTAIPKPIGLYAVLGPLLILGISSLIFAMLSIAFAMVYFMEWLLLLTLLLWVVPAGLIMLSKEEAKIEEKSL